MSSRSRTVTKLSTLEAARAIYFIVIGLAIKDSLSKIYDYRANLFPAALFGDFWHLTNFLLRELWHPTTFLPLLGLAAILLGYIFTVIRFSHKVSILVGHEKERLETTTLPSALRVSGFSLFIVSLAIALYLMSAFLPLKTDDPDLFLSNFRLFLGFTIFMLIIDLVLIYSSRMLRLGIYRAPKRIVLGNYDTIDGYQSKAALQWIRSNAILLIFFIWLLLIPSSLMSGNDLLTFQNVPYSVSITAAYYLLFGLPLLICGLVDYYQNGPFYFGGKSDWRRDYFVFVCSPMSPPENDELLDEISANFSDAEKTQYEAIEKLTEEDDRKNSLDTLLLPYKSKIIKNHIIASQKYCDFLMDQKGDSLSRKITPFASHGFYPYFLDVMSVYTERIIGTQCALSFLTACDAIYVFLPVRTDLARYQKLLRKCKLFDRLSYYDENYLTPGMQQRLREAQKLGLHVKYQDVPQQLENWHHNPKSNYVIAPWHRQAKLAPGANEQCPEFEENKLRKRVYVCTYFRGMPVADYKTESEAKKALENPATYLQLSNKIKDRIKANVSNTLWQCYELAHNENEFVAPFAPQAFFPYFYAFPVAPKYEKDEEKPDKWNITCDDPPSWQCWFERAKEILKVCDAVYIYTYNGLPDHKKLSSGMKEVEALAERLGIEIRYKKAQDPKGGWDPALPEITVVSPATLNSGNS